MVNLKSWNLFIKELRAYVVEFRHLPNKNTQLLNKKKYYWKRAKAGVLTTEQLEEFKAILAMRDLTVHTGGRRRRTKEEEQRIKDERQRIREERQRAREEKRRMKEEGRRIREEKRKMREERRRTKSVGRKTKD